MKTEQFKMNERTDMHNVQVRWNKNNNSMAQDTSNSTLEMGTSDQVLVANKKSKRTAIIVAVIVAVVLVAVVVTLSVVLTRPDDDGGVEEPWLEGPTTVLTTTTTTTIPPPEPPGPLPPTLDLEDVIQGAYNPASFDGTWAGNQLLHRNSDGALMLHDFETGISNQLLSNDSVILQRSTRFAQMSNERTHVALSYDVIPVYRHSFLARYTAIEVETLTEYHITPPGVARDDVLLQNFVWSPQGTASAFVYKNNVYYKPSLTEAALPITNTGQINEVYNGIPDWVYEEEVFASNVALWFSNTGRRIAYATFDDQAVRIMNVPHYGEPANVNYQYTRHLQIKYPKPGTNNPLVSVTLYDIDSNTPQEFGAPDSLVEPILLSVTFANDDTLAQVWTNRVQDRMIVQMCTITTCNSIFEHPEPNGWIDNNPLKFNADGSSFITILPQEINGEHYKQVVQLVTNPAGGAWTLQTRTNQHHTVLEILHWSSDDVIWYKATGIDAPSQQHVYTVNNEGTVECFSCGITNENNQPCLFNEASLSDEAERVVINCAGPSIPQIFVYNMSGERDSVWEDNSELSAALSEFQLPETIFMNFQLPDAGNLPPAEVQIQVPPGYSSRTDVPLLISVYGGPDTALVTQQWSLGWGTSLVNRWGIAVAHIDGRGSGLQGVDNAFTLKHRLGTVEIQDQIEVTRLLQELNWVDANRTCIWGWSYGGYAASLALAKGGNVFRCGMAVAPVTDWKFYDTIYTERYMDVPLQNVDGYAQSTLLTKDIAESFRDKRYFLIHGTRDDNVHYQHSMALSRLLQTEDIYFTQMSYTDEDHSLVDVRPHLYHGLEKFLRDNML